MSRGNFDFALYPLAAHAAQTLRCGTLLSCVNIWSGSFYAPIGIVTRGHRDGACRSCPFAAGMLPPASTGLSGIFRMWLDLLRRRRRDRLRLIVFIRRSRNRYCDDRHGSGNHADANRTGRDPASTARTGGLSESATCNKHRNNQCCKVLLHIELQLKNAYQANLTPDQNTVPVLCRQSIPAVRARPRWRRLRTPGRDRREFVLGLCAHDVDRALENFAGTAVQRYHLAFAQRLAADAAAAPG